MKIVKKSIGKRKDGSIQLIAQVAEDIWHAYNLICVGDQVRSTTQRNVKQVAHLGLTTVKRVRTDLTIDVSTIDCDIESATLRVSGRNLTESDHVALGEYHTLVLELNRPFTVHKEEWDSIALDRLNAICQPSSNSDVAAIVMDEGLAHICLVRQYMTTLSSKIEMSIPRKRSGHTQQHETGLQKFYDAVVKACEQHINFDVVKCVLLASPAFVRDAFFAHMCAKSPQLAAQRKKFLLVHSSSGHMNAIPEVMRDPKVMGQMSETMAVAEVLALEKFYQMLQTDSARAFYGPTHVARAAEQGAIQTLLISDNLFRSTDIAVRKKYVALVENVRENRGDVKIFSSQHPSGEQLAQLTGVAAILRYPMEDLDQESMEDVSDYGASITASE